MNSYFPPPPYEEHYPSQSRRDDFHHQEYQPHQQPQITRRPVLPPRPKTAGSRDQYVASNAADQWTGNATLRTIDGNDRNDVQWKSNAPQIPTFDAQSRFRPAVPRVASRDPYGTALAIDKQTGSTELQSGARPNLNQYRSESSRPRLMVDTETRPRTAVSREGLRDQYESSQMLHQLASSPRVGSSTGRNPDYSQWDSQSQRANLTVDTTHIRPRTADSRSRVANPMTGSYVSSPASSISPYLPSSTFSAPSSPMPSPRSSNMQRAFEDARHFAGGLISHPFESTKHVSILRHSHGLVFYQGPSTTLAISIFADHPLSADSTLWLQNKGWSGNTGMRIKALFGADGSWLNVTPTMSVGAQQLKPTDERAWQRDIARFQKKAVGHRREQHGLRTTAIVRIPAEAEDGYFQLVLCLGEKRKVLCTSPSFRVLSASTSPHSLRGASLLTMPLEMGAMAAGVYAKATAGRVVGPVVSVATSRVQKYMPSAVTKKLTSAAFDRAQITEKVTSLAGDIRNRSTQARDASYAVAGPADIDVTNVPQAPYPLCFSVPFESARTEHTDLPCLTTSQLPELISRKLHGYYFGWARAISSEKKSKDPGDWSQAIISVLSMDASQLVRASITEANKRVVSIQFTEESDRVPSSHTILEFKIMGFIRQDDPSQRAHLTIGLQAGDEAATQAAIAVFMNDVSIAQSYLDHPSWGSDCMMQQGKPERPGGLSRLKSSFTDAASKIPLDKMGIRSPIDGLRENSIVANGFWVSR